MGPAPNPDGVGWSTPDDRTPPGMINFVDGTGYSSPDIICHKQAVPGALHAKVGAGELIELQWNMWFPLHWGPIITYLASCDGPCDKVEPSKLSWFKIAERGLVKTAGTAGVGYGTWATDELLSNGNRWTVRLPEKIVAGNYVLRHEPIALQLAAEKNKAQHYPKCLNLEITGQGTEKPTGVPATELYTAQDPGLLIDVALNPQNYTIPGPALYSGAAEQDAPGGSSLAPTTTATATGTPSGGFATMSTTTGTDTPSESPAPFDPAALSSSLVAFFSSLTAPTGQPMAGGDGAPGLDFLKNLINVPAGSGSSSCQPTATVTVVSPFSSSSRPYVRFREMRII